MIKPNELRLGNWVYDSKYTKYLMQVVCIGSDYVYLDFDGNEGDLWETTPEELQGIPLTEELLTKMGFEFNGTGLWNKVEKRRAVSVNLSREFVFIEAYDKRLLDSRGWHHGVKYLHELQNIFRSMTKENLSVEL